MTRLEARFEDSRRPLDVRYDVERRVRRFLPRDVERPDQLIFRGVGSGTVELRLEAAFEAYNRYVLQFDFTSPHVESMRSAFERWTADLRLTESREAGLPERFRKVVEEAIASEAEQVVENNDEAAIAAIHQAILAGLRQGKGFFTANKEGGTHIKLVGTRFVFQDYGESDSREELRAEEEFLVRLPRFYNSEAKYDWYPHTPPEIESWRYIERKLR